MSEKKEYRSSLRSKRLIREAFLEIIKEKGFKRVTVTEIVNRADINRATFYAHYPDVRGIMQEIENELSENVSRIIKKHKTENVSETPYPFVYDVTSFVSENKGMFEILLRSEDKASFSEKLFAQAHKASALRSDIDEEKKRGLTYRTNVQFYVGGMISVYQDWILGNLNCSKEELAREICRIISATHRGREMLSGDNDSTPPILIFGLSDISTGFIRRKAFMYAKKAPTRGAFLFQSKRFSSSGGGSAEMPGRFSAGSEFGTDSSPASLRRRRLRAASRIISSAMSRTSAPAPIKT